MNPSSCRVLSVTCLALTLVFLGPALDLGAQSKPSINSLYSQAVGKYIDGDYADSYRLIQQVLERDPDNASANRLLGEVESELTDAQLNKLRREKEPVDRKKKPPAVPGDTPDKKPEPTTDTTPELSPVPDEKRRSTSPTPPSLDEEPSETIEHVNRDYEQPEGRQTVIYGLVAEDYSDRVRLRIKASGTVGYMGSRIFNPAMIILDMPNTVDRLPESPLPLNLGRLIRGRHSQYRTDPVKTTRLVMDLREWNDRYRLYRSSSGDEIIVDVYKEGTSLPPETPMVYRMDQISAPDRVETISASSEKISGDEQTVSLKSRARDSLVLRLTDSAGNPLSGKTVEYRITRGEGTIITGGEEQTAPITTKTGDGGFARASFVAGTKAGVSVIEARVPAYGLTTKFRVKVKPGQPAKLIKLSGDRQSTLYGRSVSTPLVVEARDRYGNPIPGLDLKFQDISGKGMVDISSETRGIQVRGRTDRSGRLKVDLYRTAPDVDKNKVVAQTYREKDPQLKTTFTIYGQPQLISIDFKDANLQDVLRTLAQLADWNVALTEKTEDNPISQMSITVHLENVTALRALDTILDVKGLSRVSDGNVMKIVSKKEAIKKGVSVLTPEELDDYPANNVVTVAFKMKYIKVTKNLANQIEQTLLAEQSSIVAEQTSNSLVVTDLANNLRRLRNVIDQIDRPDELFEVRVFPLDKRDPEDVQTAISSLIPTGQGNVVAHRPSNALLVYADPSLMGQVEKVVKRLDARNPLAKNLIVLDVEGYDAENLATRLNSIIGATVVELDQLEIDLGEDASLEDALSGLGEVDLGELINSAKIVPLGSLDKIIVFGPQNIRSTARKLIDKLKSKPSDYLAERTWKWVSFDKISFEKASSILDRTGGIQIQTELPTYNTFLISSQNEKDMKLIQDFIKDIESRFDGEAPVGVYRLKRVQINSGVDLSAFRDSLTTLMEGLVSPDDDSNFSFVVDRIGQSVAYTASDRSLLNAMREAIASLDHSSLNLENKEIFNFTPQYVTPQRLKGAITLQGLGEVLLTNQTQISLLVRSDRVDKVEKILQDIDNPSRSFNVVELQRRKASQEFVQNIQPVMQNLGLKVTMTAEPKTNSVLFTAPEASSDRVRKMIERLDKWQKQVLIKAVLIEVSLGEEERLNPEWLVNPSSSVNLLSRTGQFDNDGAGASFNVNTSGQFSALLNKGDFQAVLNWLRNNEKTNVITRPSITALNNRQAVLDLSQQRFFEQPVFDDEGNLQQTEFAAQSADRTLEVQPTVTEGKNVILDVAIRNDVFGPRPAAAGAPFPINTRRTENQILVQDGQTLALGGIIQSNRNKNVDRIPYLSDIPYIGKAFESKVFTKQRTELLVFITPHVLSTPEDLQEVSKKTLQEMEEVETPDELKQKRQRDRETESDQPDFSLEKKIQGTQESRIRPGGPEPETDGTGGGLTLREGALQAPGKKLNLNQANKSQLTSMIGRTFSEMIVQERQRNGYFTSFSDIRDRVNLTQQDINQLRKVYVVNVPVMNVNKANENQLKSLPGMTSELAKNIVNHRFTQGKFRSLQGLYQVFGMTEEKFQTLKPFLRVE